MLSCSSKHRARAYVILTARAAHAGRPPSFGSGPKAWLASAKAAVRGRRSADAAAASIAKRLHRNLEREQQIFTEVDGIVFMKLLNPLQARAEARFVLLASQVRLALC